jgi:hypothetical protein
MAFLLNIIKNLYFGTLYMLEKKNLILSWIPYGYFPCMACSGFHISASE